MFRIDDDFTIHLTRGDCACFGFKIKVGDGDYTFKGGDVVRLNVYEKKGCDCVVLSKDSFAVAGRQVVDISLDSEQTRFGDYINKPKDYWYELILNPSKYEETVIGYDEDGAKVFRLYPEGKDKKVSA